MSSNVVRQRPGNVPSELPSFVGRDEELASIERLIEAGRLVTVTGPGGVGKTRLALRAAERLSGAGRFPDGVWLVRLSQLREAMLLPYTIARELDLQDQTTRPMLDVLTDRLAGSRCLLVLDTCEHLVDACALLVTALLDAAPHLCVIATSRQPLGIEAESTFLVAPLPAADAERLFLQRADGDDLDRSIVVRVCGRLDGLPLAVELAAAQARSLPVEELAERLDDRFGFTEASPDRPVRHETLKTAIGWSHELCAPAERLLWARASVFAGSFTADAAAAVCAGGPLAEVPATLAALVGKSIVIREGERYRLLDTVREYGASWLAELGEGDRTRARHRDHYLAEAREAFAQWTRAGQVAAAERTAADYPEIRAALETCLREPDGTAVEMAGALWFFWFSCGFLREGRGHLERALAHDPAAPMPLRVRAMWALGCVVLAQGDLDATGHAIDDLRALGDPDATMAADYLEATSCAIRALPERATALLAALRPSPERGGLHEAIWMLVRTSTAFSMVVRGEFAAAAELAEEITAEGARRGESKFRAFGEYVRALADLGSGALAPAAEHARAAFTGHRRLGDSWGMALALDALAMATAAQGDGEGAATLLGTGERLWQQTYGRSQFGSPELVAARKACERQLREVMGDAAVDAAFERGLATDPRDL